MEAPPLRNKTLQNGTEQISNTILCLGAIACRFHKAGFEFLLFQMNLLKILLNLSKWILVGGEGVIERGTEILVIFSF